MITISLVYHHDVEKKPLRLLNKSLQKLQDNDLYYQLDLNFYNQSNTTQLRLKL